MNTVYAREDYLGADEYIDVVRKSGLNRPIEDRARVERMLAHANLILTARQDGRLVGFARALTAGGFCGYLSDLAVAKARPFHHADQSHGRGCEQFRPVRSKFVAECSRIAQRFGERADR